MMSMRVLYYRDETAIKAPACFHSSGIGGSFPAWRGAANRPEHALVRVECRLGGSLSCSRSDGAGRRDRVTLGHIKARSSPANLQDHGGGHRTSGRVGDGHLSAARYPRPFPEGLYPIGAKASEGFLKATDGYIAQGKMRPSRSLGNRQMTVSKTSKIFWHLLEIS